MEGKGEELLIFGRADRRKITNVESGGPWLRRKEGATGACQRACQPRKPPRQPPMPGKERVPPIGPRRPSAALYTPYRVLIL